jgi:phosphoadenosine phosphosulfate reductase
MDLTMDVSYFSPPPLDGIALLRHALLHAFRGEIAVVSSFGAESAVLLAFVAEIDPDTPILFLDTGQHFPETRLYRDTLVQHLGLRQVIDVTPAPAALARRDPEGMLWAFDPDTCCALRKVEPLAAALAPYRAWVTGRKRFQAETRRELPFLELVEGRVKINPLADWTPERLAAEFRRRGLPPHPLLHRGFRSIGCAPCTLPTAPGEDPRAGRWRGRMKTECGIHSSSKRALPASGKA